MTGAGIEIRRLLASDVQDFLKIRLAALADTPDAFGSTELEERSRPLEAQAERVASSHLFGGYCGTEIVAMAAITPYSTTKERHKGYLWGVFIAPVHRGKGLGDALLSTVLASARSDVEQVMLSVLEDNHAAIALYERHGFRRYGVEPRALKSGARYQSEALMALMFASSELARDADTENR